MPVAYMNDEVVVKEAQRRLQAHLPINWEGNQYNPTHAWMVLIGGVGMGASIAAMCREGREAPSGNIVRETLNEQGWDDCFIETACNALLAQSARECSWKGCFPVAIDLHEEPFYGKLSEDDPEVIRRSEAKAGTTSFHTFATAYVIRRHRRLTLALTRVRAHQSLLAVADRLRRHVEELGIEVQVYLLDRQFWTYELQMAWKAIPYIMPIRRTGKKGAQGGTRPLFDLQESQLTTYTLTPDHQEPLDIDVAVVVLSDNRGRSTQMTQASSQVIQVAGICGSLRQGSFTKMALQVALEGAQEAGAQTRLIDLRAYQLIFCDGKEDESEYPPDVFTLRQDIRAAQGIILATPEYHGGYSGVLKNALDLMGFEEFEGKMLGLVGVSGGGMGAFGALNNLRAVGRALHAWVIPEQASIPQAWQVFEASGNLKDNALEQRLKEVGRQVARFAYLHTSAQAQEFLRAWEGAPVNPGGG